MGCARKHAILGRNPALTLVAQNGGTRFSRDAVHRTSVPPTRISAEPSACRAKPVSMEMARPSSQARPDGRFVMRKILSQNRALPLPRLTRSLPAPTYSFTMIRPDPSFFRMPNSFASGLGEREAAILREIVEEYVETGANRQSHSGAALESVSVSRDDPQRHGRSWPGRAVVQPSCVRRASADREGR